MSELFKRGLNPIALQETREFLVSPVGSSSTEISIFASVIIIRTYIAMGVQF